MAKETRIPFEEAISEPRLLKPWMDMMSLPQAVWLKAMYGCQLSDKIRDDRGFSELDYWASTQGFAKTDSLGFIKSITPLPYTPREYREVWGVCGVRAGKTDRLAATVTAYEAVCGGHESHTRKGRPIICFQIAQDIRMAKYSLHSVKGVLESMAFLKTGTADSWITNITADRIELKNGVTIATTPPTVKSIRGYDSPIGVLDEIGVWYQEADSANPDFEVYNQVSSRQAQFPNAKIVGISSPWNRGGLLWARFDAGTNGRNVLCGDCRKGGPRVNCQGCVTARLPHDSRLILYSTTAVSNPVVDRNWLRGEYNKNPRAFERECLARFQDSLSGFLSSALIEKARAVGITSRPADKKFFYVAAIDPAFRRDAFGFTIVHVDPKIGIVQDYTARWHDPTGTPINPGDIFPQIAQRLHEYGIRTVHSDQYTLEALQYLAQQYSFNIEEVTFSSESKAEIYGNLQQLLNQERLSLLDDQETINELKSIERRVTQAGKVQLAAPEGLHDDMATVVAIAAHEAVWMLPKKEQQAPVPRTFIEKHLEHIANKNRFIRRQRAGDLDDW